MPTDAEKNNLIAETLNAEWMSDKCDGPLHYVVAGTTWHAQPLCPTCFGTGKVAVELHKPEYTLKLVEARARSVVLYLQTTESEQIVTSLAAVAHSTLSAGLVAKSVRDIIYDAIKQEAKP